MSSGTTGATGLAGRYATALFGLAEAEKQFDQVADDLNVLGTMIRENDDLGRLMRSPVTSRVEQGHALAKIMEKSSMCELTRRFVGVVADNRRLLALPDMIRSYLGILAAYRGEATAEVISARKLTKKQLNDIAASLKTALGTKVSVSTGVDPSLLGGLMVKVGSRMVDSSLRTKLQRLQLAMMGVK